jgi:hypothetical protein
MPLPLPYSAFDDEALEGNFDTIKKNFPLSRKHMRIEVPNVVGAADQPAFQGAWTNFDTATFHGARFWKDPMGIVHLEGLVKSGAVPSTIFILPAGYRPSNGHLFMVNSNGAVGRVDVASTGNVVAQAGNNAWFSLSGIHFKQEQ